MYFWENNFEMNLPENLKYTKDHEWVRFENEEGMAHVGITDFAQNELGDIVYLEIETLGETIEAGEVFGTVEAVKTVSDLFMPISGTIVEINSELESSPELVNSDPYGKGWLIKISVTDDQADSELLELQSYKDLIGI